MGNFKVKVNTPEESKEIQNILESIGFRKWEAWSELGSIGGFIWTDSDMTYCDNEIKYFNESPRKEITLTELRAMVKPMKEYLDKQEDGTYKLITASSGCVDRDWIEIPEGANIAVLSLNGFIVFYKDDNSDVFYTTDPGVDFSFKWELDGNGVGNREILWQREQDEPFLTPEFTLNDQYAEIEKVRQDNVNNPQHYNKGGVECIDAIEASMTPEAFKGYLKGNVQKYMWRYEQKGGVESLRKAQWYLERLIASMGS